MSARTVFRFIVKPTVFAICLVPALWIAGDAFGVTGSLGANPIEEIQDRFGNWGLRFVLIALAVTPVRQITGVMLLGQLRRMLGLFAFFYVAMHFLAWLVLDQGLLASAIIEDIAKRPFITVGFAALLLLTAMAATSTIGMRRRLGGALANAAQRCLCGWRTVRLALLVAGEAGYPRAPRLCRHPGGTARLSVVPAPTRSGRRAWSGLLHRVSALIRQAGCHQRRASTLESGSG